MSIKFEETVKEIIARDEINKKLSLCKCPFYLITGANKDTNQERIEELEIREVERESIAILNAEKRIRPDIVSMIGNETAIFFTALKKENHRKGIDGTNLDYWDIGEKVSLYKSKNEAFLRTDANKIKKDNLGDLPEF